VRCRKTQIALEYAYKRYTEPDCSVFWVHADTETSFTQDYQWMAKKLRIEDGLEGEKLLQAVRDTIEGLPKWLLVLDNADNLQLFGIGLSPQTVGNAPNLSRYVPRSSTGAVLWTSRDKRIAGSLVSTRSGINVVRMTQDQAQILLETVRNMSTSETESEDVASLLAELHWHPLAISQAAAFIERTATPIAEYLLMIRGKKRQITLTTAEHDRFRRDQASNSVLEALSITIDHIRQHNGLAYRILNVLGFTDNHNISFEMISKIACFLATQQSSVDLETHGDTDRDNIDIRDSVSDDTDWEKEHACDILEAVTRLRDFSFLHLRAAVEVQNCAYDMHKLVQDAVQHILRKGGSHNTDEKYFAKVAFEVVNDLFPTGLQRETWDTCEKYLIHAQHVAKSAGLHYSAETISSLLCAVSDYFFEVGRFRERELIDTANCKLMQDSLGEGHPSTLMIRGRYGTTLIQQGRYHEAEKIYLQILPLRQEVLGEKHPDTIRSMSDLASTYHAQGRYREAEEIGLQVLPLRQEILGEKHPQTIRSMSDLASTYHEQGRNDEAEKIRFQVLLLQQEVLGEEHPDTIWSMAEIASTHHDQGRYGEAEKIRLQVLLLRQEVLGQKHPDTISSLSDLASTYHAQGRDNEAEKIRLQVLPLREEVLGEKHPQTIGSMAALASTYHAQGRDNEAEKIRLQVLLLSQEVLGEKHPDTIRAMSELASSYYRAGRLKEAENIQIRVMEMTDGIFRPEHPAKLTYMNDLALTWKAQGRTEAAVSSMQKCVALWERTLGFNHPFTVISRTTLKRWLNESS
jgi:tetratricopeptide (TPR) repeat protein